MKIRLTVATLAALCCLVRAANDAALTPQEATSHELQAPSHEADAVTIPRMLSYQGKLTDSTGRGVRDSTYSVTFRLFPASGGGTEFWSEDQSVQTHGGLFSVLLGGVQPIVSLPDDGNCWLEMHVNPRGALTPRVRIVSAAYAYKADTAGVALAGCDNAWRRLGSDSVIETVHYVGISRGEAGNAQYGSYAYTHVNLGSTSTTGSSGQNAKYCTVGGGRYNSASDENSTVGGGSTNTAAGGYATVGGGISNLATGYQSTVGGGWTNHAEGQSATVGGGNVNSATGSCATVCGGASNVSSGQEAIVGGGLRNVASGDFSVVPGGCDDTIRSAGDYSMVAGRHAVALHSGCFVWGDGTGGRVATGGNNEWRVRTSGGVWFLTNTAHTTGAYMGPSQNGWTNVCDRTNKEGFTSVDKAQLLERFARMPVTEYRVKGQDPGVRHIGPVAQDFYAAFGCGETELGINSVDADGVLMAAVQALYEQNQELARRVAELEAGRSDK